MEIRDIPDSVFWGFAYNYPNEAHEQDPDRFYDFMQIHVPGITKEQILRILEKTAEGEE